MDGRGRRCSERHRLEFHHLEPWGRKGNHSPANVGLRCKAHNLYQAELDYGKEKMLRHRRPGSRDGVSEPAAEYSVGDAGSRSAPGHGTCTASLGEPDCGRLPHTDWVGSRV